MNRALAAGAAGMAAQQAVIDSLGANLANVDTPGYRATRPEFAALVSADGRASSADVYTQHRLFSQGRLDPTTSDYDLAVSGAGLFQVVAADGRIAYTRAGNLLPDKDGRMRLPNGAALRNVVLPKGTTAIAVSPSGAVTATVVGAAHPRLAGHITLWSFHDPNLLALGSDGLFYSSDRSGRPQSGTPGAGGLGTIKQRFLERGNLSIVGAMMAILSAQRAYEANAKTVQAADEMLRLANNLERG